MDRIGKILSFIRELYDGAETIPLHAPLLGELEKRYLCECIDSTFVSSVGAFVGEFEKRVASFTGARYAVATVNGTAALHLALKAAGVKEGDLVVTQSLTFVATCNAISYCGAEPFFVDVDCLTLGMSPESLRRFFEERTVRRNGMTVDRRTGRLVAAVVPMHTFGHPCRIDEIAALCEEYGVSLVEDAAESLGSFYNNRHTGTFGKAGVLSFNGNKTITTGGGGTVLTDDEELAKRVRHLSTVAKVPHPYEYIHDEIGYNYRMPNLNAALGCAQMERLPDILAEKRKKAAAYRDFFASMEGVEFVDQPKNAISNFWLNAVLMEPDEREAFLKKSNEAGVMTRPVWRPMHRLEIYRSCDRMPLPVTDRLADRLVNLPSGPQERICNR